ncbi:MAG: hypothetical protein WC461_02420 [Candidatus Paceibacterota bacterium]
MANFLKITFFLLIIIGGGIWFLSTGPSLFSSTPAEKISVTPAAKTQISSPVVSGSNFQGYNTSPSSGQAAQTQEITDSSIPAGYTRAQLSPYFQKIRISSAYSSSFSGYPSQIQIYSSLSKDDKVNISGWKIKSNNGKEIVIPQAVNLYDLSGFLYDSNVVISASANVSIYGNTSVINRNLRLNKCIGYLENDYEFIPQLPRNCPQVSRSSVQYLSGACQSYVLSLGSCQLPDVSFYNSLPGNDDGNACRVFLSNINYNSCIKDHRNDSDFYLNDWRIWVGKNILDPQHDAVKLFDNNGLLVDQYVY